VQILSTGDELTEPGHAAEKADAIPDSASLGVAALAARWGAACIARTRLTDELPSLRATAAEAIGQADVVVVTGGASVGDRDFAKTMFEPLGLELLFSKVAIRPGKPAWLGRAGDTLIVGLPGNPTSALVTARLFLAPLLAGMGGQPIAAALRWRGVKLASDLGPCGARETFHRAQFNGDTAAILTNQDSGAQRALAGADLLVRQPPNSAAIRAGPMVQALDF
jgi:molybdopterin molybdotransferase